LSAPVPTAAQARADLTVSATDRTSRRPFRPAAFLRFQGPAMPAPLALYDNYTRTLRRFESLDPARPVGLYTCGPTVYDYQHIGNFRTFLFEDILDIHCGGEDHIPVHHTNEIAQTQARVGTRLANYWLHGYFLLLDDAKMAKSAGEFLRVQSLLDRGYDPLVYRYLCLTAHYRTQMNFSWDAMDAAATALDRMRNGFYALAATADAQSDAASVERFGDNLNDDLNVPRALAVAWEVLRGDRPAPVKRATLAKFDQVLGLGLTEWVPRQDVAPAEIQALANARAAARAAKQWAQADDLRAEIASAGWEMEDQPAGYRLRRR
jgi:cysteinyl-tRNA synthetase